MSKLLHTVDEAGHLLSIGRTRMFELIRRGEIAAVKIGRSTRIPHAALEAYLQALQNS